MDSSIIPKELSEYIRKEAENSEYEIVGLTARGGRGFFLEIVLDKKGGITLDECTAFNKRIRSWMDEQKMFEGGYTLEVCSPGLDRPLRNDNDFLWALDKQVQVKTHEPVDGKSAVIGKLVKADGGQDITIEDEDGNEVRIERTNVAKAKLWVSI
jgi:ribosome maturation factor RimP